MTEYERARFVGGPQDGVAVIADEKAPRLPETLIADGGDRPAGYRLVRGAVGDVWDYVVDATVANAYMVETWGNAGAEAYDRVLGETGDSKAAWVAAKEAQSKEGKHDG